MTNNTAPAACWTIAYRNPRANKFHRVTDWSGTWDEAEKMASRFGIAHPELQVWYVTTLATELANENPEDVANIRVDSGRRVRVTETGSFASMGFDPRPAPAVTVIHVADADGATDIRLSNGVRIVTYPNGDLVLSDVDGRAWSILDQADPNHMTVLDLEIKPRVMPVTADLLRTGDIIIDPTGKRHTVTEPPTMERDGWRVYTTTYPRGGIMNGRYAVDGAQYNIVR